MILDKLGQGVGRPFHAQMAVDSIWEESVSSDLNDLSIQQMLQTIAQRSGRIAFEVT
jgi:hypothetical protein